MRASAPILGRIAAHLRLAEVPDAAGARLVMVGLETPPAAPPSLLWFEFANDRGEEALIGMARTGGDSWAFNGRTLKFCFRGAENGLTGLHHLALQRLAARLDGAPFERFTGIVKERTGALLSGKPSEGQRSEDWAHPDQWREFCFYSVIELCPAETFLGCYVIAGASRAIRYGDLECQTSHCVRGGVIQTPWAFALDPSRKDNCGGGPEYLAMLEDQDIILGTGVQKVERILDCLADDPSCRSLEFFNGCIPMMTGDDVRGSISRFQERTGREVVFSDMSSENCHHESLARLIADRLSTERPVPAKAPQHRYNLVGFRSTRGRDELIDLLAAAGAKMNLSIVPEFCLEDLTSYRDAAVQVLMPNRYYKDVHDVLRDRGLVTLEGRAPYGKNATAKWLSDLAALLGDEVTARLAVLLAESGKKYEPEWRSLVARAGAHRAGFVMGPGDAARLADPAQSGGAHVPAMLAEMGFGLDFIEFQEESGKPLSPELRSLMEALPDSARHASVQFADHAGLLEILRAGRLSAVYSNVRNDRRLTRNGLIGFSLRDFEMGFSGALRTIRRLVERCEVPFFREYSKHLRAGS